MRMRWISLFSLLSIVLTGCGASQVNTEDPTTAPKEPASPSSPSPTTPKQWDDMPIDPPLPITPNPGLEALIQSAKADLAQKLSIPASQIKATETKEVFWPDASLGCPQPGIAYNQIPTPGYLIMLVYSENKFEYHADIHGNILHCENPTAPISDIPLE